MKESQDHNQYNLAFIETKPGFNRFDIIHRITYSFRQTRVLDTLYILFPKKYSLCLITCKNNSSKCVEDKVSMDDFLQRVFEKTYIVNLDEKVPFFIRNIYALKSSRQIRSRRILFVSGIHSDIPYTLLRKIKSVSSGFVNLSLGTIPYLASSIPVILDLILSSNLAEII